MGTRQLIQELRRDGERREREAEERREQREREAEQREREAKERHEQRERQANERRAWEQAEADRRQQESDALIRRMEEETAALIQRLGEESRIDRLRHEAALRESRQATREMLAELREHGERMRIGFDAIFGAFADLSREMRGWRDEDGGSGAAA